MVCSSREGTRERESEHAREGEEKRREEKRTGVFTDQINLKSDLQIALICAI